MNHSKINLSLRLRFIIVIVTFLLVLFTILAYLLLRNARVNLTTDLNKNSTAFAQLAVRPIGDAYTAYQNYGSARVEQEVKKFTPLDDNNTNITIVDINGSKLFELTKDNHSISKPSANSFDPTYVKSSNGAFATIIQPYVDTNGQHQFGVIFSFASSQLETTLRQQFVTIIALSLFGLIVTAGIVYWLINRLFLRPLEAVSRSSLAISNGDYAKQIETNRHDEIGDLAQSVNQMATNLKNDIAKLQEVDELKNEFIMITSHNLRTPLTIIEGSIEMVKMAQLPANVMLMIKNIETGIKRLNSLSEDIMTIASIEDGKTQLNTTAVSLEQLLTPIKARFSEAAQLRGIELVWEVTDPAAVCNISVSHIRSLLSNLLDNALKFNVEGGMVHCNVQVTTHDFVAKVSDNGIGIKPEEMSKLFTKFHRGTSTLTYDYEGTGIGLYASKLIAQAHHGKIVASSTFGHGSTFTLTLFGAAMNTEHAMTTDQSVRIISNFLL